MINLKSRIKNHKSTIGVISLGYVGLPPAIWFLEVGLNTWFIELVGETNKKMPHYVVQKVGEALNSVGKPI